MSPRESVSSKRLAATVGLAWLRNARHEDRSHGQAKAAPNASRPPRRAEYTVLARRYRPQQFADLVGQEPVAQALVNALESGRVAHAYLFTGARGVGKTSHRPHPRQGAQLREGPDRRRPATSATSAKASPPARTSTSSRSTAPATAASTRSASSAATSSTGRSRARYKIYIIDEVHMLTDAGVQRPAQDARRAAAARQVHLRHHRSRRRSRSRSCRAASASTSPASACRGSSSGCKRDRRQREDAGRRRGPASWSPAGPAARCATPSRCSISCWLRRRAADGRAGPPAARHRPRRARRRPGRRRARQGREAGPRAGRPRPPTQGLQLGELLDQLIDYWRDLMVVQLRRRPRRRPERPGAAPRDARAAGAGTAARHDPRRARRPAATQARLRGSSHGRVVLEMALVRLGRLDDLVPLVAAGAVAGAGRRRRDAGAPPAAATAAAPGRRAAGGGKKKA